MAIEQLALPLNETPETAPIDSVTHAQLLQYHIALQMIQRKINEIVEELNGLL